MASAGWPSAAEARGGAVVIVVAPGVWSPGLTNLAPRVRTDVFTLRLEKPGEPVRCCTA